MKQLFIFSSLLLFSAAVQAQNGYEQVDSTMRAYTQKITGPEDLWRLTYFIRKQFTEDSLRLRAGFIWITENIEYDIKAFQNEDVRAGQLDYVVRKKKAVCAGYAGLLKYFCDAFKIECLVVDGRARASKADINITNTKFRSNHAWNAVKIGEQWRLMDPTWASGSVDDEDELRPKYHKNFNEFYYCAPPDRFALNHYPTQVQYGYVDKLPRFAEFAKAPLVSSHGAEGSITSFNPSAALIEAMVGDSVLFRFQSAEPLSRISFRSEREKVDYDALPLSYGDWYEVRYPVKASGIYNLHIGFNDDRFISVSYKLKAENKY